MAQAAFNTIAEVQRLRDSGIEQAHAEAITLAIHSGVTGGVATKADLDLLKTELEGRIEAQGETLRREIAESRADLTREIAETRLELTREIAETRVELLGQIGDVRADLGGQIGDVRADLGGQIGKLAAEIADGRAEVARGQLVQLRWLIGSMIALGAVMVAALALG
jgi:F0F1-type ATP synthase membrane subunit b/b'